MCKRVEQQYKTVWRNVTPHRSHFVCVDENVFYWAVLLICLMLVMTDIQGLRH